VHVTKSTMGRLWIELLPVQTELGNCLTRNLHLLGKRLLILENLIHQLSAKVHLSGHLLLRSIDISHFSE